MGIEFTMSVHSFTVHTMVRIQVSTDLQCQAVKLLEPVVLPTLEVRVVHIVHVPSADTIELGLNEHRKL